MPMETPASDKNDLILFEINECTANKTDSRNNLKTIIICKDIFFPSIALLLIGFTTLILIKKTFVS